MKYKIFIISILRNKKRYESLVNKLLEQNFDKNLINIFIGVDYKTLDDTILKKISSKWGLITPKSVLSCAASHILLWKHISTLKDIDYAIILEDDSYIIKSLFMKYQDEIEKKISDKVFLNLSTSVRINEHKQNNENLFVKSHLILALDSYILTPKLCGELFNFYKTNGLSYHIDLHLAFIKNYVDFDLIHFNRKITKENLRLESSMVASHDKKFILALLKDKEVYKELNTPMIEINNITFNGYTFLVLLLILLSLILTFYIYDYIKYNSIFICMGIIWYILGMLIYDML